MNKIDVLIIDDDANFRMLVNLKLSSWKKDLNIIEAENLADAKKILDRNLPTLIVLDQHLPDGLGPSILSHKNTERAAILATSSDSSPELMGNAVKAGAGHFLNKTQIKEALFIPLIEALIESKKLEIELMEARLKDSKLDTIKTLISTLRHEINNPLGGIMGASYLLNIDTSAFSDDQIKALRLVEQSTLRIKTVIEQLYKTAEIDAEIQEVEKGSEKLFQVPGDSNWDKK